MLKKRYLEILEENDIEISITEYPEGDRLAEIQFYSDAGEDFSEAFYFTPETFAEDFSVMADEFDPDEHAEMWVDLRGKRGVPDSIRTLIDDADWIKEKLMDVADELMNAVEDQES